MLRIVYTSRVRPPLPAADFDALVDVSAACNRADGITGLLLCDGLRFLQAIEGEEAPTRACYHRILQDPRHHDVVLMEERGTDERQFGTWSLGGRNLFRPDPGHRDGVARDVAAVRDPRLKAMFIGFAVLAR